MKNIVQRTITGAVYVALLVVAAICGDAFFAIVFSFILVAGILEFSKLNYQGQKIPWLTVIMDSVGGVVLFLSLFAACMSHNVHWLLCYVPYVLLRPIVQLYIKGNTIESLKISAMGQLYIAMMLSLLNFIYFEYGDIHLLLASLIFIWVNDTGAFCIGSLTGKHRLFERISPKKTWEGFFGGLVFNIIAALISYGCFYDISECFSILEWTSYSLLVTIFATWGDLLESLIKRSVGAKDSGHMLPGHGGVLDRIDSLLLVTPMTLLFFFLIS